MKHSKAVAGADWRKFQARVELTFHPDIHPEDAENAFKAWFWRTLKDSPKPPDVILEKALVATAMNAKDGKRVVASVWRDAADNVIAVSDGFDVRWKRAQKDGRVAIWDPIDVFMMRNWRVMRPSWPELANYPGLWEWAPKAATLLLYALVKNPTPHPLAKKVEDKGRIWYIKKRERLGLRCKLPYRVLDLKLYCGARIDPIIRRNPDVFCQRCTMI